MKKTWGMLIQFGENMWEESSAQSKLGFDYQVWCNIVDKCLEYGFDNIVFDLGEGIRYTKHPELWIEGGWTPEEMNKEVKRVREKGIKLIPKLNFSAAHDTWLRDYGKEKMSTPEYYEMCKDLIEEVYEIFDHPEYIHLGLDEEFREIASPENHYRVGEELFKDWAYLIKCVRDTGAEAYIWEDVCIYYEEELWKKYVDKNVLLAGGQYYEYDKSCWTPVSEQSDWVKGYYWGEGFKMKKARYAEYVSRYGDKPIEYVEQDPGVQNRIDFMKNCIEDDRKFVAISSNIFCKTNDRSTVKFVNDSDFGDKVVGFLGCPWRRTHKEHEAAILEEIELLGNAKREFYGE